VPNCEAVITGVKSLDSNAVERRGGQEFCTNRLIMMSDGYRSKINTGLPYRCRTNPQLKLLLQVQTQGLVLHLPITSSFQQPNEETESVKLRRVTWNKKATRYKHEYSQYASRSANKLSV
jgi:hypothetical protein